MQNLLERRDEPELAATLAAPEYDIAKGYDLWSRAYDAPLRLFFIEQGPMHALFATLPAGTMLDAARGTGRHGVQLAQAGYRVMASIARRRCSPRHAPSCRKAISGEGDLTVLPLETASVDAVVCALALVHLPELGSAMAQFARVLRPGGRVIVSDVHPFLIMLGWQAQFRTEGGDAGFMRLNAHLLSGLWTGGESRRPSHQVASEAAVDAPVGRKGAAARSQSRGLGRTAGRRDLGSRDSLIAATTHGRARKIGARHARRRYRWAGCWSACTVSAGRLRARIIRRTG